MAASINATASYTTSGDTPSNVDVGGLQRRIFG